MNTYNAVDLMIKPDNDGIYDLVIEYNGIQSVNSFDTAFAMMMFCERRADPSEIPTPEYRRGWVCNLWLSDTGFEIGSKLWLLEQERRTQDVLNKAVDYVKQACQWLLDDGHVKKIEVSGELISYGGIGIHIQYLTFDNKTEARYYEMWRNTGKQVVFPAKRTKANMRWEWTQTEQVIPTEDLPPDVEIGDAAIFQDVTYIGGKIKLEQGGYLLLDNRVESRKA